MKNEKHDLLQQENETAHVIEEVFWVISITILGIFGVEQILLLFCFDIHYFKHPMYIIDSIIIAGSLIVELVLRDVFGALFALFRLWRIARITHAIVIAVEQNHHHELARICGNLLKIEEYMNEGNTEKAKELLGHMKDELLSEDLKLLMNETPHLYTGKGVTLP